ncbi:D-alanyl-D-alanine carboxypeptidase [Desulfosporosinus fructosivorans]|uniref:D-alanyl-D-alanine carboxypeptidase n=1 Tax=Desulfosporosinus fructosivorans TaxID=2018669 RepID=A0A4Z0R1T9_9FIRM|nr:D-alanyl-D-alanine carboxypeptidase family protein [Desulfosporosinus fructosivorans]TGE37042.1 D-alanyl-D-alanine carboxypeptidase [Desulfosporosinus fructosivorans]
MKFFTTFLLTILIMVSVTPPSFAEDTTSKAPQIRGEGAYLIDVLSGQTLYMKNPDEPLAPASTTKIMTGLLAIELGDLNDIVTPTSTLLNNKLVYGTQIYLEPGEKMPLKDLLYALLLNSANDAAVAIAEHIGSDLPTFVEMMNQRAREIGATNTHFLNPSGLTESGHTTTAHDLALIARVAYQNPTFAQYVRTKSQPISRSKTDIPKLMVNENKLLWRDSAVDGIKPGYTAAAQNCLVASVTKDGRQFIGVILKSPGPEIYTDMQALFEFGFTQFKSTIFKPSGSIISTTTVNNEPVNLILDRPIYMTQKIDDQSSVLDLKVIPTSSSTLTSVEEGQVVAQVEISDDSTLLGTLPLKSTRTILPPTVKRSLFSNYFSWTTGAILIGVILLLLISAKIRADRRWRRKMRLARNRYSMRESSD